MAELALEQTPDLGDYLSAFKRRLGLIITVAGVIFALGVITAFTWPPTYQSTSTILIEAQEVPAELIQSTVTSFADQRIQVISQRVMTRNNLIEIMDTYGLYTDDRRRKTIEEVIEKMRSDISIDMITAEVVDPRTGRPAAATIAFTLGFKSENPVQAQKVAGEITTLFLNENLKTRTEKAAETYDFLTDEAGRLKKEITHHEKLLAEFKERNINTLPESRSLNEQALDRAEQQVAGIDTQIQSLKERKIYLEGQLPLLDPYRGGDTLSPGARLDELRTEYITLSSRYSPDHPDVTSLKREIEALEKETGNYASMDDLRDRMEILQQELATAQELYTDEHPDVKSLKRQIAALQEEIDNTPATKSTPVNPNNPSYVNLQTQLAAANSDINSLNARRALVLEKMAMYEERLLQTPKTEQVYRSILRDLEQASSRYENIKGKEMAAGVGKEMEKERKGEKFTLIDPAVLPQEPISPNRPAIIFLSLVLALGAGVGSSAIAESLSSAIRGSKGVVAILQTAPLAVIPYLPNTVDIRAKARKKRILIAIVIAGIVIAVLLVHFLFSPLDVLWFRVIRKVNTLLGGYGVEG
jgi:uncharacterized protein involved in exopolysaccharide biosynthesis